MHPRPTLTLLGFGAFGQLLAQALAPHVRLCVLEPGATARAQARAQGHACPEPGTPEAVRALAAEILVLAMPLPALGPCLERIAPHLAPGQLVVDVCSIKEEPARLMQALLPAGVEILASHPMFGPQSAAGGLAGLQLVLCPLRGRRWHRLAAFLRARLGLRILVTTPEAHDREAAETQGLTHLLARAIEAGGGRRIRTRSFEMLEAALALVRQDSPEVFDTITRHNRHVGAVRSGLIAALDALGPPD